MAQAPSIRPATPQIVPKSPRELVREIADALTPLMHIGGSPWEHVEVPVGPATSVSIRFKGPVGRAEMGTLIKHLTLLVETLPPGDFGRAATPEELRKIMEDALKIKMSEGAAQ